MLRFIYFILSLIIFPFLMHGNVSDTVSVQLNITLSGCIGDAVSGERLAGVTVIETNLKTGTSTNSYGYYSISIPPGKWDLQLSYIGYKTINHKGYAVKNLQHDFVLEQDEKLLLLPSSYALESGLYISDEYTLSGNLTLKYGLRFAMFQNLGPGTSFEYDREYIPADSIIYPSGKIFNTYSALEPRFAFIIHGPSILFLMTPTLM